mmetsp:Transcript_81863/g.210904  ORF Transcript_81863/g.210904 Transcript_81863/m.210904 type:complete len:292 (-) Transcript_81863:121-996(-)
MRGWLQAQMPSGSNFGEEDSSIQLPTILSVGASMAATNTSRLTSRAASFETAHSQGDGDSPGSLRISGRQLSGSSCQEEPFVEVVDLTWTSSAPPSLLSPAESKEQARRRSRCCRRVRGACLGLLLVLGILRASDRIRHGGPPDGKLPPALRGSEQGTLLDGMELEPEDAKRRGFVQLLRYTGAVTAGTAALALSMEPPAGQLASCVALGALISFRASAARWGGFWGTLAAMGGAMLGCLTAVVVYEFLAPLLGLALRRCCRGSDLWGWIGFMVAGLAPAVLLLQELLRLC